MTASHSAFKVEIIPMLDDNLSYLVWIPTTQESIAIDPVQPEKTLSRMKELKLPVDRLRALLLTHHHWDHAGGNEKFKSMLADLNFKDIPIVGNDKRIPALNHELQFQGKEYRQVLRPLFGSDDIKILAFKTPGHTVGSVCYHLKSETSEYGALFTGDTLFLGGCGRFLEPNFSSKQSAEQMNHSLNSVLSECDPIKTLVYCGHEYTLGNLAFAAHVEPNNKAVGERIEVVKEDLKSRNTSVPALLALEYETNPFMRLKEIAKAKGWDVEDHVSAMERVRELKNNF